jgi:hypothetical protein
VRLIDATISQTLLPPTSADNADFFIKSLSNVFPSRAATAAEILALQTRLELRAIGRNHRNRRKNATRKRP